MFNPGDIVQINYGSLKGVVAHVKKVSSDGLVIVNDVNEEFVGNYNCYDLLHYEVAGFKIPKNEPTKV